MMPPTSNHLDATTPTNTVGGPHIAPANSKPAQSWPVVDVSLVTFNSSGWLPKFFASLLAQDYPIARIRVLATDNGSSDGSFQALQDFVRQHGAKFAQVVVTRQANRGFGAGHNVNLRAALAEYFLVTNVDLEFERDMLVRLIEQALASPTDVASWECRQKPYEHPKYYHPATLETSWCSSACVLLRTAALRQVAGYDEALFMYGEDVDLSYRLRECGYRLLYAPRAVCWHYGHTPGETRATEFLGISLANLLLRLRFGGLRERLSIPLVYLSRWWIVLFHPRFAWGLMKLLPKFIRQAPAFLRSRPRSTASFPFRGVGYEINRDRVPYECQRSKQTDRPLVSIVIRTYAGRLGFLREAVASVLNQTYPNLELIVVEDGETGFARKFLHDCAVKSSIAIRYITSPKSGRCRAGNTGLAAARGRYLGFLDDDDYFFADHVETLVTRLLDSPRYAAAYSAAWEIATHVKSAEPLIYQERSRRTIYRQPFCRGLLWQHNYIPIQAILFDRQLYERHGGFDESLELLEDWNLWTRFSLDAEFYFVDKTTSGYRVPADTSQQRERARKFHDYYQVAKDKQRELLATIDRRTAARIEKERGAHARPTALAPRAWKYLRDRGLRAAMLRTARELGIRFGFC
jgi:GT2 family glycosyltransferase